MKHEREIEKKEERKKEKREEGTEKAGREHAKVKKSRQEENMTLGKAVYSRKTQIYRENNE